MLLTEESEYNTVTATNKHVIVTKQIVTKPNEALK